ncbi:hypothetical protein SH528x_002947 [Novipirellula sp. SH528]|uniref:hypothetical protein n=1 Tax=Novipirellula sp. SH528 TaxID=3454466 RepID=UPI003FA097D6
MDIIKSIAIQVPMMIASLAFVVAAVLKVGKERGAMLIVLGAVGLFLLTIANPIIYSGIIPKVIENMETNDHEHIPRIYLVVNIITSIFWTSAIVLISIGTFLRSPPVRQP